MQAVLHYILDHARGDQRPYLEVNILGQTFLGLLDSGSSRTILGSKGWSALVNIGIKLKRGDIESCTVANGQTCRVLGSCDLPIRLRDRIRVIDVLVVPELPHVLILGWDFWTQMGVIPYLNEWHFSDEPPLVSSVEYVQGHAVLSKIEKMRLDAVIERNKQLAGTTFGCTTRAEHVIVTDSPPIKQRYYRVSPVLQRCIDRELEDMLSKGIVEKSNSPWSSPVVMVRKKDGSYRFCVDYRKLNAVTMRDSYPLPMVADTLDKLKDARYLSSLDIKSAYWQVPLAKDSRQYTAFSVPNRGLYQFCRMPMGLHNSAATWQRLMDSILGPDLEPNVFVYLDDVVIVTQTFEKHLSVLEEVFRRLREANLTISFEKCQFCRPQMRYLGYVVDKHGLHVDPDKVQAMLDIPSPKGVGDVRRILGTFSWYRRFVPDFASIVAPITALLKKSTKFAWTNECESAFRLMKERLITAPVLSCPDYSLPFIIQTDASAFGIGACLTQPCADGDKVISYLSRSLSKQERNYSTTERECLAVLWAIEKLRPYIEGIPFTVLTDHHSLVWLQNLKDPHGRLARWSVRLQQYDFKIVHRKGELHVTPDLLSRSVPVIDALVPVEPDIVDKWYINTVKKVRKDPVKFSNWRVTEGLLYKYVKSKYPKLDDEKDVWKRVVPKPDRRQLIVNAHDPPTAGHIGVNKTYFKLAEQYYWPKMRSDVAAYVRKCQVCATYKPSNDTPRERMQSHPKVDRPWEMISTDLMGPLPRSTKGNSFILVVTDYLSKFSLVFPLRTSSAEVVARKIEEEVFLVFGVPRVIICDNGPQYRSNRFQKLAAQYACKIKYTANYHPRANPTERVNRTIKTMLAIYARDSQRLWDKEIHKIACAIRTSRHETTKVTPYFVNFGRRMILSGDQYEDLALAENIDKPDDITRSEKLREMYKDVRKRLEEAGRKQDHMYNLRRRGNEFEIGQAVWRKNYAISDAAAYFSSKLAPRYIGPFFIKRKVSSWTYELQDDVGKSRGIWHAKDLKQAAPEDAN